MRTAFFCALFLAATQVATPVHADTYHPHWTRCALHFGPQGGFDHKTCWHFPMGRETRRPIGHRWRIDQRRSTPHTQVRVRFPTFQAPATTAPTIPSGRVVWLQVTGYAPGCGDSGYGMAHGGQPFYGAVASSVLPAGTHVYVPSLRYSGVVLDTGAPLDIWEPSCSLTYALTGVREVIVTR